MRVNHFARPTEAAALDLLEKMTQAEFGKLLFRLSVQDCIPGDNATSVGKKIVALGRELAKNGQRMISTVDGQVTLSEGVVRAAIAMTPQRHAFSDLQNRFERALALDGFIIQWDEEGGMEPVLRAALPGEMDLPAADDEVHQILDYFHFTVSKGHLDQAIEAHTRGDWAAANSQTRTFMESLFEEIAHNVNQAEASRLATSENRRTMLAHMGFLSEVRNEWTQDGKSYINGLFKMLHTEGSHPGLSDEDRSTFRLHLVLLTARTFLRRLKNKK